MWGYSIACAKNGVWHTLLPSLQLEPSSQFGVTISSAPFDSPLRDRLPTDEASHHILHYTFSHEYSYEGVPTSLMWSDEVGCVAHQDARPSIQ